MHELTNTNYKMFTQLASLDQETLRRIMAKYLKEKYNDLKFTKEYILAKGNIPITLVAHLDTVFKFPPEEFFYDRKKNVIWSPDGLGADDRAGVFAIIQILKTGLRPHIILTTDEESGALGASAVIRDYPQAFTEMRYLIELDRRGTNDCVFYDCDNEKFSNYIESFGFTQNYGSFSDISVLCPAWGIAGVNLSIGYKDEHSYQERLYVSAMLATIDKVCKMLREAPKDSFKYIPMFYLSDKLYDFWGSPIETKCEKCNCVISSYEAIPVITDIDKFDVYCGDCIVDTNISWCDGCGEAFKIVEGKNNLLCPKCMGRKEAL